MSKEHQPGSPVVDLDELEREARAGLIAITDDTDSQDPVLLGLLAELRTLRARVAELETDSTPADWNAAEVALNKALHLQRENEQLRARVGELEEHVEFIKTVTKRGRRIAELESQLAAAREEQGLEARVREALGPRWFELLISRAVTGTWTAHWNKPEPAQTAHRAIAETLPALLRAILEVEAKGG